MALYDKASLVLIPSGTKEGVIFSQKPTNGDGDFTFSRSTAATRVNADGLIEKETQNLLLQSNTFDTTWVTSGLNKTSGQSGYDGSSDAWLIENVAGGARFLTQTGFGLGVSTFSVYAKVGNVNLVALNNGIGGVAYFNLSTGAIGTTTSIIDAKIQNIGSGWYRCSMAISSANEIRIYPASTDGSLSTAIGSTIYIQDSQLEEGLVARDYIETTTSAVYGGITDNIPRLDYTDASCPSLLLEPQRTNLVTQSEYFGDSVWSKQGGISVAANNAISPSGYTDASKIELTATDGKIQYQTTGLSGTYTFSVFAKKGNHNFVYIFIARPSGNITRWINLDNGSITNGAGAAEVSTQDYGNGWYSIIYTFEADATYTNITIEVADDGSSAGTIGDNIYIYGAQVEQGSYATSYIPTYGSAVTRNVDFVKKTSASDLIGQTEGTLYIDLNITTIDSNSFLFGLYGGSPRNEIYFRSQTNNRISFIHYYEGTIAGIFTSTLLEGRHKLAACYKNNDWVLYLDGVLVGTDTSGSFVGGMHSISLGYDSSGVYQPFESVNKILLFKTRLTNEELAALTTI